MTHLRPSLTTVLTVPDQVSQNFISSGYALSPWFVQYLMPRAMCSTGLFAIRQYAFLEFAHSCAFCGEIPNEISFPSWFLAIPCLTKRFSPGKSTNFPSTSPPHLLCNTFGNMDFLSCFANSSSIT